MNKTKLGCVFLLASAFLWAGAVPLQAQVAFRGFVRLQLLLGGHELALEPAFEVAKAALEGELESGLVN